MPRLFPDKDRDWTSGSIHKAVVTLAFPIMLGNVLRTAYDLIDLAFIGQLEEASASQAAVVTCGHVMFPVFAALMGLATAPMAMVARAIGEKNQERADHVAAQSLLLAFVAAAAVGSLGFIFAPELLSLLGASSRPEAAAGADVLAIATVYLRIMLLGVFAMFPIFVAAGIMRGAGDTVTPLVISAIGVAINIPLDWIMIFGHFGFPALGVKGAAIASVTSQGIVFVVGLYILIAGKTRIRLRLNSFRPDLAIMRQIIVIGVPNSIQMTLRALMGTVLMRIVWQFGVTMVAGYGVVMRLHRLGFMPTFGIAAASATLVGQNLGARKPDRAQRRAIVCLLLSVSIMGAAAVLFSAFAPYLVRGFNAEPGVIAAGTDMLRITAPALLFAAVGITLGRSVNGAGETVIPMMITLVGLWGVQVPLAWYLSGVPSLGEHGLYWANVAAGLVQAAGISAYFYSGHWKKKRIWREEGPSAEEGHAESEGDRLDTEVPGRPG